MKTELKQVIVIRRELKMRQGKACSQTAHASAEFMREYLLSFIRQESVNITDNELEWMTTGMAKITVRTNSIEEFEDIRMKAEDAGLKVRIITDSGKTEFGNIPTVTAMAIGPDRSEKIDTVTGHLELL